MFIKQRQKLAAKWALVILLLGIIVYTFRNSAGSILSQLKETKPAVIAVICMMSAVYHVLEGRITEILAREYQPGFTWKMGIANALYCSFCRVATLGSGSGVAAVYYLNEHGVGYGQAFGLYMLQYALHKISIALFSLLFFVLSWGDMHLHFQAYLGLLLMGYLVTGVIAVCLILCCCSARFHRGLFRVLDLVNRKANNKLGVLIAQLWEQCSMMEEASRYLLRRKSMIIRIIGLNIFKLCFWYAIPYVLLREKADIALHMAMAVTSLSVMLAAVLPAPAGIGTTEFVFITLFSEITEEKTAGAASLLYRFAVFVFPFLMGAAVVVARRFKKKRGSAASAKNSFGNKENI